MNTLDRSAEWAAENPMNAGSPGPGERGEGKAGCIVILAVVILLGALGGKLLPVWYADNTLTDTASDLASKASILSSATLDAQLKDKARELEIPEALQPGAMEITVTGDKWAGTCVIRLKFTRKVNLYGVYDYTIDMDKTIRKPYLDTR
jgi:hypothetical protein